MSHKLIDIKVVEPRILSVTIKNYKKRNALSDSIKIELEKLALELRDNTEIIAIILSGEKGVFSSGNDLNEKNAFGEGLDLLKARQQNRLGLRMCDAWTNLPQITVASIEGDCIGGGVSLALSCDFRFCSENAYFFAPEVDIGITYSWGSIPKLVSLVGPAKAKIITIACKKIDAKTALNWGLCEEIAKDPFGTGTRIAFDVSLPSNAGIAFATALPAPVSVITIFKAADLPLLFLVCILSTKF